MDTDRYKKELNSEQFEAVTAVEGPVLVLAGAGTGKTRVIIYRIAYMINEMNINPRNILAVTFTNKAANEMKNRLKTLVGDRAIDVWMGTFHATCLKLLRRDGYKIDLPSSFGVVDQEDRLAIVRQAIKNSGLNIKEYPPRQYLHAISAFKNTEKYVSGGFPDETQKFPELRKIYTAYQENIVNQKMIDFDDMLGLTVRMLRSDEETLSEYRKLFKYILVDEYQDTNAVQFLLLRLLAGESGNLCVVGDDDQSIYGWRGAEVRNILDFDKNFQNVREIKLTNNYRSGEVILEKANNLISKNQERRGKMLKPDCDKSAKVKIVQLDDERSEAEYVASFASQAESQGKNLSDIAVLYRTNAQSRNFEVALNRRRIAYKVIGSVGFYQRREIKDILSYLRFYDNRFDEVSFRRSVKNPARGIGDALIDKIVSYAHANDADLLESAGKVKGTAKTAASLREYIEIIKGIGDCKTIKDKVEYIVEKTDYLEYLKQFEEEDDASLRIDNIGELRSAAAAFDEQERVSSLSDFLANTALVTSSDADDSSGAVRLMTMHAAKGLEFKTVFLTGLEEGLFPLSSAEEEGKMEEERRLCYVGITRAMEELYITRASSRYMFNSRRLSIPSRFLNDIAANGAIGAQSEKRKADSSGIIRIKPGTGSLGARFPVSSKVNHAVFGDGVVVASEGAGTSEKVTVQFKKSGIKKVLAGFLNPR